MADRRPPQRPANTAARRNAPSGARPAGSRPSGYRPSGARPSGARPSGYRPSGGGNAPRRSAPPQRGGKRVSGRFYAFLGIVALIIIAVVLLIWRPWATNPDPVDPGVIAATPAVMAPAADATVAPDAPDAQDAQAENGAEPQASTALSDLLGSENTEIAGLTDDQMVQVSDLSVNTSLSPEWQNILLLGVDQRVQGESCRSDTMIICSINTQTAEVKLTSLMRDMAVEFTDLGSNNGTYRLNAANYFGGPEFTMKTINELLDMNIEKYVMVNFTGFTQIC